jgi:hypothetical protein
MKDDEGWLDAENYTPKYSAVFELARLMVAQEAYERKKEAMRKLPEDDNEITEAIAREVLYKDLMLLDVDSQGQVDSTQVPGIDWDTMVDNPTENRVGWSFLDDERSRFEVDGKWWLYQCMFTEQKVRQRFTTEASEGRRPVIRKEIADAYQRHVDQFREKLLLLFHLCGGQPGRAPEVLGLRWKNTPKEAPGTYSSRMGWWHLLPGIKKGTAAVAISKSSTGICPGRWGSCWYIICAWFCRSMGGCGWRAAKGGAIVRFYGETARRSSIDIGPDPGGIDRPRIVQPRT